MRIHFLLCICHCCWITDTVQLFVSAANVKSHIRERTRQWIKIKDLHVFHTKHIQSNNVASLWLVMHGLLPCDRSLKTSYWQKEWLLSINLGNTNNMIQLFHPSGVCVEKKLPRRCTSTCYQKSEQCAWLCKSTMHTLSLSLLVLLSPDNSLHAIFMRWTYHLPTVVTVTWLAGWLAMHFNTENTCVCRVTTDKNYK